MRDGRTQDPMDSIREIVVVEGRDDTARVREAVDAVTIETHGFGISSRTWQEIEKAYKTSGIIVFTDPDRAGEEIRRRIKERFPEAKEAFLIRDEAEKDGDIGIENASPEAIRAALERARPTYRGQETFTMEDLRKAGLCGMPDSAEKREKIARILGIGYGNSKAFLNKLNGFGITREEFNGALESTGHKSHKE